MQNITALGGHVLLELGVAFPVRQGQIDDKPFPEKTDFTGGDGDIPGRQISLHCQRVAALDKQRSADGLNDIKTELAAMGRQ